MIYSKENCVRASPPLPAGQPFYKCFVLPLLNSRKRTASTPYCGTHTAQFCICPMYILFHIYFVHLIHSLCPFLSLIHLAMSTSWSLVAVQSTCVRNIDCQYVPSQLASHTHHILTSPHIPHTSSHGLHLIHPHKS
jgi:hypothetical protein